MSSPVGYDPQTVIVEGYGPYTYVKSTAPFTPGYNLTVTSPDSIPTGNSYTIGFKVQVTANPGDPNAATYVSISPSTLTFTGPSQPQTVTVNVSFPAGAVVGNYAYLITTTGWPTVPGVTITDAGSKITMGVLAPTSPPAAPSVVINSPPAGSVYTYVAGNPPLQIPFSYTASTTTSDPPITESDADLSGVTVLSASGLSVSQYTGAGTLQVSAGGIYALNARATNSVGTTVVSQEFTVNVTGSAPTITNLAPTDGSTYTYVTGGNAVSIPVSCTVTSSYGGIQSVSASLNGVAVPGFVFTPSAPGSLTGTAASPIPLQITAGNTYQLVVTATDGLGTSTATTTFTVTEVPPPTITISQPANGVAVPWPSSATSITVPLTFSIAAGSGNVTTASVTVNNVPQAITVSGLGTPTASFNGTLQLTSPGICTVNVTATDANATSSAIAQFPVTLVPPPTVTISQPTSGTRIQWPVGTTFLNVPIAFTASAGSGNVTAATVTLNGVPVGAAIPVGTPAISFTGTIPITAPGNYTLGVSVSDSYGTTVASAPFAVVQPTPPVIGITQPTNGAVITRQAGAPPTAVPFAFTATESAIGPVSAVSVTLNGSPVTASLSGLNTAQVSGSGTLQISTAGTYTLAVAATAGGAQANASVTFTVNETAGSPPVRSLLWLPPISLNKPFQGGSTIPIAFCILDEKGNFVRDQSIVIAVVKDGGSPDLFTWGPIFDRDDSTYAIVLFAYRLNYDTDRGKHTYRIDVYNFWPVGSSTPNLIGSRIITTKGGGRNNDDD